MSLPAAKSESFADTQKVAPSEPVSPAPSTPARPSLQEYSQDRQPTSGFTDTEGGKESNNNEAKATEKQQEETPQQDNKEQEKNEEREQERNNQQAKKEQQEKKMQQEKKQQQQDKEQQEEKEQQEPTSKNNKHTSEDEQDGCPLSETEIESNDVPESYALSLLDSKGKSIPLGTIPVQGDAKAQAPPQNHASLSQGAIDKRLRRVFTPRTDGSFKVPMRFVQEFQKKGAARKSLEKVLASCAYNVDRLSCV